jgi:hypothetical protein
MHSQIQLDAISNSKDETIFSNSLEVDDDSSSRLCTSSLRVLHLGDEDIPPSPVGPCLALPCLTCKPLSALKGINKFTFDGPFHLFRLGKVLLNVGGEFVVSLDISLGKG